MKEAFVLLDDGDPERRRLYRTPGRIILARRPSAVPRALKAMRAALEAGLHLAGYASYELGLLLEPRLAALAPERPSAPYLAFGVFRAPEFQEGPPPGPQAPAGVLSARSLRARADYAPRFAKVQDYLRAGDAYQINLTFPLRVKTHGTPQDLHAAIRGRQKGARFGGICALGWPIAVSWSPESFYRIDSQGLIRARPMKGTIKRGASPEEDAALAAWLRADPKSRAENLMIVDLLRNDIGRLSRIGTVRVPELFSVETYPTLHTMTSEIQGEILNPRDPQAVFRALFPCGSITGAPKIRAMEIIHEVEARPRGIYCGAMGWMSPDGAAGFNVAIRTLALGPTGTGIFGVGGGVLVDSEMEAEYDEALLKARFLLGETPLKGI
ncbi:aminodeoxychorismate synthase component I [Neomegalonema perideroedes]|uniref:aminodeoxychorismate synthase component I n=1 Tax=Neomegalonema perideroedes TaxID=217219 RepID=UPI0003631DE4|nr:aminodeoxychorismate synthase component I [Neomegalonema perideroedes]